MSMRDHNQHDHTSTGSEASMRDHDQHDHTSTGSEASMRDHNQPDHKSTGSEAFSLLKRLDANKFVLLFIFALLRRFVLKLGKITAQEYKKSISGWRGLLKNVSA